MKNKKNVLQGIETSIKRHAGKYITVVEYNGLKEYYIRDCNRRLVNYVKEVVE